MKDDFYQKYKRVYDAITNGEKSCTDKEAFDVIVRNAKQNLTELKKIANLFKMDEDFKRTILDADINKMTL